MLTNARPATILRFGVFEIDLDAGELRKAGIRLKLQQQPFQILKILVQRPGEIVTRDELRSEIWSADTFVDFDNSLNTSINKLRDVLGDTSVNPRFIETIPRRGYRFISPVTSNGHQETAQERRWRARDLRRKLLFPVLAASLLLIAVVTGLISYLPRPKHPEVSGTLVLGEFVNRTGDPVFDGTLKQGLSVQLEQSPQLRVLPEEQLRDTLRMMAREENAELTPEITREVCQRNGATVAMNGSISAIGPKYELVLRAADCNSGDLLASTEAHSDDKNHVLDAITKLAADMREKLGESLTSVREYNIPLESATTRSLPALRCYTLGLEAIKTFDSKAAMSWYQKAIELDPKFAMAYWLLGNSYGDTGESSTAKLYMRRAFELRGPVSQREKWLIEGGYYYFVLGDLVKARRTFELLAKIYPDSQYAHNSVADIVESLGEYEAGLAEYLQALHQPPRTSFLYRDVANTYLLLDRVDDAVAQVREAHAAGLDSNLGAVIYSIAFYRNDEAEMSRQVTAVTGKAGVEDLVLALDADTAAYFGHLEKARTVSKRAAEAAEGIGQKESSAQYYAASAVREGVFGNPKRAREQAMIARKYPGGRDLDYGVALAATYSGDLEHSEIMAREIANKYPQDTIVQCNYLPTLRARLALMRSKPEQAIDELEPAVPCDLNLPAYSYYNWPNLYPVYVRGEAYLAAHRGPEAAGEFQKIIAHRGLVLNEPIGVLAHLQLGRAYVLSGKKAKARESYERFLAVVKDADPDVPTIEKAKAEFASLFGRRVD